MKRFLEWIGIKQNLDDREHQPPLISEGDLWWCAVGENVGIEVNGKSKDFTRPVIILKKFGRLGFLGIPTTTQARTGTWFVPFLHKGISETAVLSQARVLSYKRLHSKMGTLDETDFQNIKEAYVRLFTS
jgi:mRNA interferase MazF